MVTLKNGIIASSTNESIFKLWKMDHYTWSFKTNGKLDLEPPQVVKYEIYPYPDKYPDSYAVGSQSTKGLATVLMNNPRNLKAKTPIKLQGEYYLGKQ
jgi:hypothetical protein